MKSQVVELLQAAIEDLRSAIYRQEILISQLFCLVFDTYFYEIILDDLRSALVERQSELAVSNSAT